MVLTKTFYLLVNLVNQVSSFGRAKSLNKYGKNASNHHQSLNRRRTICFLTAVSYQAN